MSFLKSKPTNSIGMKTISVSGVNSQTADTSLFLSMPATKSISGGGGGKIRGK